MSADTIAQADRTIEERDPGSTRNLYLGAAGSALVGIATCCLSGLGVFYVLLAPAALFSGGWTIQHLIRNRDVQAQLGTTGYAVVLLLSIVGVLFGLLAIAFGALALIGANVRTL